MWLFAFQCVSVCVAVRAGLGWATRWHREPFLVHIHFFAHRHCRHHRRRRLLVISAVRLQLCHSNDYNWSDVKLSALFAVCVCVGVCATYNHNCFGEEKSVWQSVKPKNVKRIEENSRHSYQLWPLVHSASLVLLLFCQEHIVSCLIVYCVCRFFRSSLHFMLLFFGCEPF